MLTLFWTFFKIGIMSFGGGYACLPLIQSNIVQDLHWISASEFSNLVTISQMTPGPIAINAATFVGLKVGGFSGGVIATIGCIFPSCLIVTILAVLYHKYSTLHWLDRILNWLRPAVVGLIAVAGITMILPSIQGYEHPLWWILLFSGSLFCFMKTKIGPIWILIATGVINWLASILFF
ncbi:hypothetical protein C815_01404 [Firmicutes bacterium M10-2]|nr:hypothetical protein C815_01404 [Firmicutes bacterium M10-2]